jgi:hypothetical protein
VHARDRRGGRRAQVDAAGRGPVRVPPGHRAQHGLPQRLRADRDVAADVVRVAGLLGDGGTHGPGQDQVAEAGGEPLDLRLDPAGHVDVRAGRHVAVGPQRLLAGRGAGRVGHAGLDDQHVRGVGVPARGHLGLGRGDLLEGAAQVQGPGPAAVLVGPRHRAGEREVHLADAGPVTEPAQRGGVPSWQPVAGHLEQRLGRDVEEDRLSRGQLGQRAHPAAGLDAAAQLAQGRGQRVGDPGAAARHHRPAHRVRQPGQHQPDAGGGRRGERHHGVGGGARQDRTGFVGMPAPGHRGGGQDRATAEVRGGERVGGRGAQRSQEGRQDLVHVAGQRAEQVAVGASVGAEAAGRLGHRAGHHRRPAAVEGMRELHLGEGQRDPALGQAEALEERGGHRQRVGGRADVVPEAGQRQFLGPAAAADGRRALDDLHRDSGGGQGNRGREPVGPAAHDDRVRT